MNATSETTFINTEVWSPVDPGRQKEASHSEQISFLKEKCTGEESSYQRSPFSVSTGQIAGLGWLEMGI